MHFDGSLMKQGGSQGLVFISPLSVRMRYVIHVHVLTSNNVAEDEALINGLRITIELGIRRLDVRGDSHLVVDQVIKESSCLNPKMAAYC
jgi:ribonuclease HI